MDKDGEHWLGTLFLTVSHMLNKIRPKGKHWRAVEFRKTSMLCWLNQVSSDAFLWVVFFMHDFLLLAG